MADILKLSRLVAGVQRQVDLSQNALVVGSLKVGVSSPTELTKALLDSLLAIRTDLASNANALGASLVGIEDVAAQFTATNVEGALAESLDAAQAAQATADAALPKAGGTMTGAITLHADPTADLHAATKQYVDDSIEALPAPMEYKGVWNANTNSPTLADGVGSQGALYRVSTAGSQDLGSGSISFDIGDIVVYNGTTWEKWDTIDQVLSVNGQTGAVDLDSDDIDEGATNLYWTETRFDLSLANKTTDDLNEGSSNLYFTDARAKSAAVADAINDSVTDVAPSQNAVFDALAGKSNTGHTHTASEVTDFTSAARTAAVVDSLAGSQTDQAPSVSSVNAALAALSSDSLREEMTAGEELPAALRAVRMAKGAEDAGRVYLADNDAETSDNFWAIGLVAPGATVDAADPVQVIKAGKMTATAHGLTVGQPIFLGASGALTQTAPSAADEAVVHVGMVRDANTIEVRIQVMGIN